MFPTVSTIATIQQLLKSQEGFQHFPRCKLPRLFANHALRRQFLQVRDAAA